MSKNKVPNVLKVSGIGDGLGQSQFIETRILEPQSFTQQQLLFQLPKVGILNSNAYIKLQVQTASVHQRFPLWAGVWSQIETATLFCGGVQVAQSRGVGHLWTLKNFFRDPHNRNHKQSIRTGAASAMSVNTLVAGNVGTWGVDPSEDYFSQNGNDFDVQLEYRPQTDANDSGEWRLYLSDIFPLLHRNNLPLGLMDDNFTVVLDFQDNNVRGERSVMAGANAWSTASTMTIVKPQLVADLIFYDDDINAKETTMEKLRKELDSGTNLPFTDMVYVKQYQASSTAGSIVDNQALLGLDHQVVRRIFMSTPRTNDYANAPTSGNEILGNYYSEGSNQQNTLQLSINAQPIYPSPISSDNRLHDQLSQTFPTPYKINQAVYSAVGQCDAVGGLVASAAQVTDKQVFGKSQQGMINRGHYYGINLSKQYTNQLGTGTAVGRQPVVLELTDKLSAANLGPKDLHIWAECERVLSIKHGKIMVSGS